jgi:hypothetical protein
MSQTGTSSISILKVAGRFCLPAALASIFCLFAGHACAQSPAPDSTSRSPDCSPGACGACRDS